LQKTVWFYLLQLLRNYILKCVQGFMDNLYNKNENLAPEKCSFLPKTWQQAKSWCESGGRMRGQENLSIKVWWEPRLKSTFYNTRIIIVIIFRRRWLNISKVTRLHSYGKLPHSSYSRWDATRGSRLWNSRQHTPGRRLQIRAKDTLRCRRWASNRASDARSHWCVPTVSRPVPPFARACAARWSLGGNCAMQRGEQFRFDATRRGKSGSRVHSPPSAMLNMNLCGVLCVRSTTTTPGCFDAGLLSALGFAAGSDGVRRHATLQWGEKKTEEKRKSSAT